MKNITNLLVFVLLFILIISCGNIKRNSSGSSNLFRSDEQELEYYYAFTEATRLYVFGNYKDAINIYNQCLKYNPNSAAVNFQLSNIFLRIGQIDAAKGYALRCKELDNGNIWYLLHLASIYQLQRKLDSTILLYEKIVRLDKKNVTNLSNLALLYKENKQYKPALRALNIISEHTGVNERIIFSKHDIFVKLRKQKKAIKELENGIKIFPDNIDLYGLLAEYYSDIGKKNEAEFLYKKILTMDSLNHKVLLSYADFLINSDRGSEAFNYYEKSIFCDDIDIKDKISLMVNFLNNYNILNMYQDEIASLMLNFKNNYPNDIRIRALSSDINIRIGNFNVASEDIKYFIQHHGSAYNEWEKLLYVENLMSNYDSVILYSDIALKKFSDKPTLHLFKGVAFFLKGDYRNSVNTLISGTDYCVNDGERTQFYTYLAENYQRLSIYDSSDYFFEKVLLIDNENLIVRNNYSYYLSLRKENLHRAKEISKLTIKKEPRNSTYLDTYAWILFNSGKAKDALKFIELAVKYSNSKNPEILDHYGDILYSLSRFFDARNVWKMALELYNENNEITEKIKSINELLLKR